MRPLSHAFYPFGAVCRHWERSRKWLFAFLDSDCVRHVGGMILKNPVTRASQSGDGGLSLEPGGFEKSGHCDATEWLRLA